MPTCPAGHDSADPDFCDVCGMRIGGATLAPAEQDPGSGVSASSPAPASAGSDAPAEPCPQCGTIKSG